MTQEKIFSIVVVVLILVGCSRDSGDNLLESGNRGRNSNLAAFASENSAKEFTVFARRFEFEPSVITVEQGDLVKITLINEDAPHGISIPEFGVDIKADAGEMTMVKFTADKVGAFKFHCNIFCGSGHSGMQGDLIVTE